MKCTILTVGTEILFGSIVNTNAVFLSQELQNIGVDVMYHMTCGDNPKRLKEMLAHAYEDCDLIITTGGLGPTQDDLTKENIAEFFGEKLVMNEVEKQRIIDWFAQTGRPCTENNYKQAVFPEHCTILPNPMGTAPGFMISKEGRILASLPGPPVEMRPMFTQYVKPVLAGMCDSRLYYKSLRFIDIGESYLETKLLPLIDGQTDPTLATYATPFECSLRIASKRATLEEAQKAVDDMAEKVRAIVGENIYSEDGSTIDQVVLKLLLSRKISLSSAESITGGQFAKTVTDMAGISEIFDRGIVTYSNRAKMEELGVSAETLDRYGAVSEQTAGEMAEGLYRVTGSDVCVSVTGIAGPDGGTAETPVGTFFVGVCYKGKVSVKKHFVNRRTRANIRDGAVQFMFRDIYKVLRDLT